MVNPLPKYLFESYCVLFSSFGLDDFDFQKAVNVLKHNDQYTGQIISKLEKEGWLKKRREVEDARKKVYHLNDIEKIIDTIGKKARERK